MTYPETDMETR